MLLSLHQRTARLSTSAQMPTTRASALTGWCRRTLAPIFREVSKTMSQACNPPTMEPDASSTCMPFSDQMAHGKHTNGRLALSIVTLVAPGTTMGLPTQDLRTCQRSARVSLMTTSTQSSAPEVRLFFLFLLKIKHVLSKHR
jgi:hypothetical protein